MKSYETFPDVKSNIEEENVKETLSFSREYNGYFLRGSTKCIAMKSLTKEEYFKFLAGDVKTYFPEYNSELHYYDTPIYNNISELAHDNTIPVQLFEYVESPNKFFGCYLFESTNRGTLLKKLEFSRDEYIDLKNNFNLHEDFNVFRKNKGKYEKLFGKGRARKGLLFYGPPGNGKTAQISQLARFAESEKFRVFFIDKNLSLRDLFPFKSLFENEDNIFIIEELTERAEGRSSEELLSFLDGELSWNNSYVIATTNNPEELPWNLVDRPSRFKVKLEFPNPTAEEREIYLKHMKVPQVSLSETIKLTEGMSLDYIKNIVLDSFLEDKTIPEIIKLNKDEHEKVSNKFKTKKIGIA